VSFYRINARPPDPPPPTWWQMNRFLVWEHIKVSAAVVCILGVFFGYTGGLAYAVQQSVFALSGKEIPYIACFFLTLAFSPKLKRE
jgi:hypothetical protein